jgi:mannose-6-phosphate isomerase-like protein (cupin superfamily)
MPTNRTAHLRPADALRRLPGTSGLRFVSVFRHGTLEIELYAPRGRDPQTPHTRDELYVVVSGNGTFYDGSERRAFSPGDCMFVAAGVEHRFEDFTDDLAVWVMFYGPEGGEPA